MHLIFFKSTEFLLFSNTTQIALRGNNICQTLGLEIFKYVGLSWGKKSNNILETQSHGTGLLVMFWLKKKAF